MDDKTLRLECLKLAANLPAAAPETVEEAARRYASFVLGASSEPSECTRRKCPESTSE
jgi:hypothetical protein